MMKRIGLLVMVMVGIFLPFKGFGAIDFRYNGINYTVISEGLRTVKTREGGWAHGGTTSRFIPGNEVRGEVIIPEKVYYNDKEYTVIEIGKNSFFDQHYIYNLELPNTLVTISESAFEGCYMIPFVNLPSSLREIGNRAFAYCIGLTDIVIPENVVSLGVGIFGGCYDLAKLTFNARECEEAYGSFTSYIEEFYFGPEVKIIPSYCCSGLDALKEVEVPNSVISIGDYAFRNTAISQIILPLSLTHIGRGAFAYTKFPDIEIPYSVSYLGDNAFAASNIEEIIIPNSVNNLGEMVFQDCKELRHVRFPASIDRIPKYSCQNCSNLQSVEIPNTLREIDYGAFQGCTNLKQIVIPNSVKTISPYSFDDTPSLESITLGYGIEYISGKNFNNPSDIYITTQNPPLIFSETFRNYDGNIYILPRSLSSFKNAYGWDKFKNFYSIVEAEALYVEKEEICGGKGEKIQLKATLLPEGTTLQTIFWTSSDYSVADVDADGCVMIIDPYRSCKIMAQSLYPDLNTVEINVKPTMENPDNGVDSIIQNDETERETFVIYNLQGVCVKRNATRDDMINLAPGIYVINGKKVLI